MLSHFSRVQLSVTPWTMTSQPPLSMGFSRQEYWSGLPLPSPLQRRVTKPVCLNYYWSPHTLEPVLCIREATAKRSLCITTGNEPSLAATRESPCAAVKTQQNNNKRCPVDCSHLTRAGGSDIGVAHCPVASWCWLVRGLSFPCVDLYSISVLMTWWLASPRMSNPIGREPGRICPCDDLATGTTENQFSHIILTGNGL